MQLAETGVILDRRVNPCSLGLGATEYPSPPAIVISRIPTSEPHAREARRAWLLTPGLKGGWGTGGARCSSDGSTVRGSLSLIASLPSKQDFAGILILPPSGAFPIGISVQGFAGLQRALRRVEGGAQPEMRARLRAIGERIALVAAGDAPRNTGELQHSIKTSVKNAGASIYSNAVYGGAINYGAWTQHGRGPHISRRGASHYMNRAVTQTSSWVEGEIDGLLDWVVSTFEKD